MKYSIGSLRTTVKLDILQLKRKILICKRKPRLNREQKNLSNSIRTYNLLSCIGRYDLIPKRQALTDRLIIKNDIKKLTLNDDEFIISHTLNLARDLDKDSKSLNWIFDYIKYLTEKFLDFETCRVVKDEENLEIYLYKYGDQVCIYKYINQSVNITQLNWIIESYKLPSSRLFFFIDKDILTEDFRRCLNKYQRVIRSLTYDNQTGSVFGEKLHINNNSVSFKLEIVPKPRYVDEDLIKYAFYYGYGTLH